MSEASPTAPTADIANSHADPSRRRGQSVSPERGRRSLASRRAAYRFGLKAEGFVSRYLHSLGYTILASRERGTSTEVDLIAARDEMVAFVEVKARKSGFEGLDAVGPRKRRQLMRAANEWLSKNPAYASFSQRFDIALVWPTGLPDYLENAFEFEDENDYVP